MFHTKFQTNYLKIAVALSSVTVAAMPLFAQDDGGSAAPPQGLFGGNFLFIMAAMFGIIYFVMIRPEKKRQKERAEKLAALKKGDKVITIGGVVGVIVAVKDTTHLIKTGEGAVIEFTKSAIQGPVADSGNVSNDGAQIENKESR